MKRLNKIIKSLKIVESLIYILSYALILNVMSLIFKNTIQIDNSCFGIWSLIASTLILIINKTIKPLIVRLTIPITVLTLGIFYLLINFFILKIVDFILGKHLIINGIIMPCIVAILVSLLDFIIDRKVIKPIIKEG